MIDFVEFNNGKGYWKTGLLIEDKLFSLTGYVKEPFTIREIKGCHHCSNLLIKWLKSK